MKSSIFRSIKMLHFLKSLQSVGVGCGSTVSLEFILFMKKELTRVFVFVFLNEITEEL